MNLKKRNGWSFNKSEIPKQKKLFVFFALIMSILLCATLSAQEASPPMRLSPDEAVELALRSNLSLESSRTSLETRRRASQYSWNQFIPSVTIGAGLAHNDSRSFLQDESSIPDILLEQMNLETTRWGITGQIQASLNINIAMFENMKRLRLDYEGGLLSYEKAKLQLERDVRKMYHNILLLQENIALLQSSFENVERQVQMAQANFNAGLAPELTLLQAQVARENMRPGIAQLENALKLQMAQFAMYLGLDYNTPFELIPVTENIDFIPFDVAEMITRAANGKPDILELRHSILMLQSARQAQVYALTPTLTLSWNTTPFFFLDPKPETTLRLPLTASTINPLGNITNQFSIMLSFRLHSLIPFSTDSQGIKNLDDQIRTASIGLAQLINGTEIEIYNTVLALERTRVSVEAQAQTVDLAERSYRLTEEAYRAGLQDYFQVQNAEQSLRQARVQMLEQQFNYLNGLIDLEYSTGVPFGTLSRRSR